MGRAAAIFLMKRDDLSRPGVGIKYGRRAAAITVFIITAESSTCANTRHHSKLLIYEVDP